MDVNVYSSAKNTYRIDTGGAQEKDVQNALVEIMNEVLASIDYAEGEMLTIMVDFTAPPDTISV